MSFIGRSKKKGKGESGKNKGGIYALKIYCGKLGLGTEAVTKDFGLWCGLPAAGTKSSSKASGISSTERGKPQFFKERGPIAKWSIFRDRWE